jgi:UDP-N-acetylglucosamine 2-epimerase
LQWRRFAHVEAGLRTGDLRQPFPQELNRRVASIVADLHLAPTALAARRLFDEGVSAEQVLVTGNTVIDALQYAANLPYDWSAGPLGGVPSTGELVLVTGHRRESFGETFRQLCYAIRDLALRFAQQGVTFVYPVHPNPNVRLPVLDILGSVEGIMLLEPLD